MDCFCLIADEKKYLVLGKFETHIYPNEVSVPCIAIVTASELILLTCVI